MRLAVDVMGGDHAPGAILRGCFDAAAELEPNDRLLLLGDAARITAALDAEPLDERRKQYEVIATSDEIAMDESPVEAVRTKPNSAISQMVRMVSKGEADACLSAGNTGACVAASQMRLRTLPGVSRPGIAIILPTFAGPVVICDVGANIAPKARHLQQYALMASAYAEAICGIANPRVGLLSVGEEDAKGTDMVKEARTLMRDEPQINFVGNVEGRELFKGVVDVVVCDGFVGNIVLKFTEGLFEGIFRTLLAEVGELAPEMLSAMKPLLGKLKQKHDWREYGAAPLLGVGGVSLICHGSSDALAIRNAIRTGRQFLRSGLNETIVRRVERCIAVEEA